MLTDARSEQEAIEGMRWLLRVAAMSTHILADANPDAPRFQRMDTWVRKAGGDNPDAEYYLAAIDGTNDYRITGNLGTVQHLSFTINAGQGMERRRQVGYVNEKDLTTDENGNFTLLLHKSKPSDDNQVFDWVQIPEDTSAILVRAYIADRDTERLPQLDIEVEGGNPPYQPPSGRDYCRCYYWHQLCFFCPDQSTSHRVARINGDHQHIYPRHAGQTREGYRRLR